MTRNTSEKKRKLLLLLSSGVSTANVPRKGFEVQLVASGNPTKELVSCIFTSEVKTTVCVFSKLTGEVSFVRPKGETVVFFMLIETQVDSKVAPNVS